MDVKEIFEGALNQKAEHLDDVIEIIRKEVDSFQEKLEDRKGNDSNVGGNYYLEGIIDGMQHVNKLLKIYNER